MKAKRLLSILLCLVLAVSMLCVTAMGTDIDADLGVGDNPFLDDIDITKQPESQTVAMGDVVSLTVQAQTSAADAVFTYRWFIQGESATAIVNNDVYTGANTATLSINTANTDWCKTGGVSVFCRINNGKKDIDSNVATIQTNGHAAGQLIIDLKPTCSEEGKGHTECIYCGTVVQGLLVVDKDKNAHGDGKWETVKKPTTTAEGLAECRCIKCGTLLDSEKVDKIEKSALDTFTDIKAGDWFVDNGSIDFVYNANLFVGTSDTTFGPHGKMNRAMFVTVLGRLHGIDGAKKVSSFSDVKKDDYFSGYVVWANQNGIVSGITTTSFGPYQNITREQICAIMYRYCNFANIKLKNINAPITFNDANKISSYAAQAVAACQRGGLVSGKGAGMFDPKGTATRAEVATIMLKFSENYMR